MLIFKGLRVSHRMVIPFFSVIAITVSSTQSHSSGCGRPQRVSGVWLTSITTLHKAQGHSATSTKPSLGLVREAKPLSHPTNLCSPSPPPKPLSHIVKINSMLQHHRAGMRMVVLGLFSQEKQIKVAPATTQHRS